jgi:ribulose-phosphate 3-epimerase
MTNVPNGEPFVLLWILCYIFCMKTEIIPAILPMDYTEIEEKISLVKDFVKTVQIDICDGQFTPTPTWPYRKDDDMFGKILKEEEGLPGWEKLNFEIDLMVNHPEQIVDEWVSAGATRIIIHTEAQGDVVAAVDMLVGRVEIALALNIDSPISSIEPFKDKIQGIQLMGIDHIGFQGQAFDVKVIDRVKEARAAYPELPISIDGGVSLDNAQSLYDAGANRLVVGSKIFNADNYLEALQQLKAVGR